MMVRDEVMLIKPITRLIFGKNPSKYIFRTIKASSGEYKLHHTTLILVRPGICI